MVATLVEYVDEQIPDELKVDFNVIEPEVILKNMREIQPILTGLSDPINSALKIIEIIAKLPSQNVDAYLVDLVAEIREKNESDKPLEKLTKLAC